MTEKFRRVERDRSKMDDRGVRYGKRDERGRRNCARADGGGKESKEVAAVRKLLFKIGIPLRLVGTRNADRVEATKTVRVVERGCGKGGVEGTRSEGIRKNGNARYCFVIEGNSVAMGASILPLKNIRTLAYIFDKIYSQNYIYIRL